jgi:hypothetical protein
MAVSKKKYTLEEIIKEFEKKQENLIKTTLRQIMLLFDENVTHLAYLYARRRLISNRFLPKDIRQTIDRITSTVNARTKDIIIIGIRKSFKNAEDKNDIIETRVAGNGRRIPPGRKVRTIPGASGSRKGTITAVDEFIKRKINGLNLSRRVFKLSNSYKKAISDTIIEGLKQGTSARDLAKELRRNLRNNKYQEHPGRGVYRSPQKNAMRLARNEINIAYANADYERWQQIESIIGIEVRLSNRHPRYDICDDMKGRYPKDFHFIKWHPNCLCVAIPILAPVEVRDKIMDFKLGLTDEVPKIPYITDIPSKATAWMEKNAERVKGWKNTPMWIEANKSRVGKIFS